MRRFCPTCSALFRGDVAHCHRDGGTLEPATGDPLLGRKLGRGRYTLIRCLGEGSVGRVYLAEHRHGRLFAIKVMFGELTVMPDVVERFRNEAAAASRLDHRNIVSVVDAGLDHAEEPLFLVMDYASGQTLSEYIRSNGALSARDARKILDGVAAGLAHAHAHGVLHRDLKPDNIILTDDTLTPRIIDFGVSRLQPARARAPLTSTGRAVGTPGFIAPEVLRGRVGDARADLYALGVCAYFAVTANYPFEKDEAQAVSKTLSGVSLHALSGVRDAELCHWITALLAMAPDDRPASVEVARQQLRVADWTLSPSLQTISTEPHRRLRRLVAPITAGLGAVLVAGGLLALSTMEVGEDPGAANLLARSSMKAAGPELPRAPKSTRRATTGPPTEALVQRYAAVGRRLQALEPQVGLAALRSTYLEIQIAEALRRSEDFDDTLKQIVALEKAVDALSNQGISPLSP
ncbi:MAG: serine/threonine-protein kinase [Myxococcota bacterium]